MITIPQTVTLAAGAATWLLGVAVVKRVKLLQRYNLPAPVVGGILIAAVFAVLKAEAIEPPKFDTRLVPPLMIAFFSSLGFGASLRDLCRGGRAVIYFLVACSVLLVLQLAVGVLVALAVGEPATFGVVTSIVSLTGGPGTALSFAPEFEKAGLHSAATIGVATAMLGIVTGGLLGSPVATWLIGKQGSNSRASTLDLSEKHPEVGENAGAATLPMDKLAAELIYHIAWILIIGSVGYYLSQAITRAGVKLPFYVGSMIIAFVVRNLEEAYGWFRLKKEWVDAIGGAALILFVSVSMMTLELWTVAGVAGPLVLNLTVQAALMCAVALTVMYRLEGGDYDAAVMSGGLVGFMMGTTANAMATMSAVTQRFGPAPRAFLVVPIVGACFIDFINAIVISIALTLTSSS